MWASLSGDDRRVWKDKAAEELDALKKEADKCEVLAARAEEDLTEALSLAKERHRYDDSTECDELCDGQGGYWEPRLQWDVADAPLVPAGNELSFVKDRPLECFANAADIIAGPGSSFVQKIVVCTLTKTEKITVTGNSLRVTSPRFPVHEIKSNSGGDARNDGNDPTGWPIQSCTGLESREKVRSVLDEEFGIGSKETADL